MASTPFAGPGAPAGANWNGNGSGEAVQQQPMSPARSVQVSEAELFRRCKEAVEQCGNDLKDLRSAVRGANSHREKCAELLGAATEAVLALEQMLFDPDIDLPRERHLQALASKVLAAINQGEAVVKVYGSMGGFAKLASKLCSPGIPLKFDAPIAELTSLAKQARVARTMQPAAGRMVSATSTIAEGAPLVSAPTGQMSSLPPVLTTAGSGSSSKAPSSPAPTQTPAQLAAITSTATGATGASSSMAVSSPSAAVGSPGAGAPPELQYSQDDQLGYQAVFVGNRQVPEEALQVAKVRNGARGQAVLAMVYVPPAPSDPDGHLGYLWYFLSKSVFSTGSMFVFDLSNSIETELAESKQDAAVTCLHLERETSYIWSGHRNGNVRVWSAERREAMATARVCKSAITALTTDEHGRAWVGSDKGKVRCYRLEYQTSLSVGLGFTLVRRGELMCVGEGMPAPEHLSTDVGDGMVSSPLARDPAHYGPVRSICAATDRVWTCGGSTAFATFKEWTQTGILLGSTSMRSMGLANHMCIVSPIVMVHVPERVSSMATAGSSFSTMQTVSRLPTAATRELPQAWQLLTAHDNGIVQVWGLIESSNRLQPLLRIGDRVAPAMRIIICEPLGALITAHNDGKLRLRALPHPRSPAGLKFTFQDGNVGKVPDQAMPVAQVETSKTGTADAVGGFVGVITASNYATIKHYPTAELRRLAEESGIVLLNQQSEMDQWPLVCYSSGGLQQALHQIQEQQSLELGAFAEARRAITEREGSEAPERSILRDATEGSNWQIDWSELTRTKVIGEGAFGKVWLGRWQETDVAIKQLGSLSALGVQSGSLQHDSSGGVKLDNDMQRALDREVGLLQRMRHPNIILFMGVVLEPLAVVTEFCARGSLYDLLKEARIYQPLAKQLSWERRILMALDAAKGMLYLHGHKPAIIHRDLKSPNLLVEKNWRVKVTDFNLSRANDPASVQSSLVANNPRWQPPEVIMRQEYGKASDVYAYGLILWELLTWELPFENLSNFQIMLAVTQQNQRPPVPDQFAAGELPGGTFSGYDAYVALMQRCWAEDPQDRPTFEQVIADLRGVADIMKAAARGASQARAGGPVLLPSQSRNFARASVPQVAPAAAPAAAPAGSLPPAAFAAAGAAAAGAAAMAARGPAQIDSAYLGPEPPLPVERQVLQQQAQQQQQQQMMSEGSDAPVSTATSGSLMQRDASGMSVVSTASPAPSPFDAPVSSNAALPPGPFGGGGGSPSTVSSNAAVPPGPFGGGGGSPSTVSSNAAVPPGPFGGGAAAPFVSSNAAVPPGPFGGGGGAAATVSSNAAVPAGPFGGSHGQTVSSSAPPVPSPFGGGNSMTAGGVISSSAAPPPSPFGDGPAAGQQVSSSAAPAPSPFDSQPHAAQVVSSSAPPPPSPFGGGPPAGQTISSAAAPPPSPFGDAALPALVVGAGTAAGAAAAAGQSAAGRLSPYAARVPAEPQPSIPGSHTTLPDSLPSTVLEASESAEAGSAGASGVAGAAARGGAGAAANPTPDGNLSSQSSQRDSHLVDSVLSSAGTGRLPSGSVEPSEEEAAAGASLAEPAVAADARASSNGSAAQAGSEPSRRSLIGKLKQSLSSNPRRLSRSLTR